VALLPQRLRAVVPHRLRDDPRLRALAVGLGVIPPRLMHSPAEGRLLAELARSASRAMEIGVYEGSSARVIYGSLPVDAELHLVDPFGQHSMALPQGWGATEWATRRVMTRAERHGGPRVYWHVRRSEEVAPEWTGSIDLLFVDGDHAEEAVARDWEMWNPFIAPGGRVVFHDARDAGRPFCGGLPGPTAVVDRLFRTADAVPGWAIESEVDRAVVVRRDA
jgi:predicted O-methyltransferase YrrM